MTFTLRALAFASRWFDQRTVRHTFEPLVADWQREWQEAIPSRRTWVSLRGLAAFICAAVVSMPSLMRTHAPRTVANRVALRMTRFIVLTSIVLMYPFLPQIAQSGWRVVVLIAVVPQAIAVVFPFSMIGAVDAIRRCEPVPPHVERALVAKLAVIAVLFMIVFHGFVVPAGNQLFRVTTSPGAAPVPGLRELNTYQLITDPTLAAAHEPYTAGADRATRVQRELNNRAALALVPVLLLWLRWRALESGRGTRWSPLPASLVTATVFAAYFAAFSFGFHLEREYEWVAGAGHWVPLAALTIWGLAADYSRRAHLGTQAP